MRVGRRLGSTASARSPSVTRTSPSAIRAAAPGDHLVELEVLGPLTQLAPGEATTLEIGWSLTAR